MFQNPLVVGHKGEIGRYILQGLLACMPKASNILAFDKHEDDTERLERIEKADIIFLCVPYNETLNWFQTYVHLLKGKKIVEQTTRKDMFLGDATKHLLRNCDLIHAHLLFRPSGTPNREDRKCAIIKGALAVDACFISAITDSEIVLFDSIEEHDNAMSIEQTLVHRNILSMANVIKRSGGPRTFMAKRICELAERIRKGDCELYNAIQQNPHADSAFLKYDAMVKQEFGNIWWNI